MAAAEQNAKNHARLVPIYHIGVFFPLLAAFVWFAYRLVQQPSVDAFMLAMVTFVLLIGFFSIRTQVLTVQDRVIRLEMRLRLRGLLPADLAARAEALPVKQLIALRFACDAELPDLVGEIVGGRLSEPKEIKARIVKWQADHLRA
jgi:hypothetical protein